MKKIIAILITLTMLFSVLSIMPAFAYTGYETVWTQNFDNTNDGGNWTNTTSTDTKSSYTDGGRVYGQQGNTDIDIVTKDGSQCLVFSTTDTTNKSKGGVRIAIDNSKLEVGKTYRLKVNVCIEPSSNCTGSGKGIRFSYSQGFSGDRYANVATDPFVNLNQWTTIYTEEFEYTEQLAALNLGINARFETIGGYYLHSVSEDDRDKVYIDNLTVEEVVTDYFKNTKGEKISTTADAGYYADTFDADVKTGAISFDAYISDNDDDVASYDSFGMYVYRLGYEDGKQSVFATGDDAKNSLKDANGLINVLVEEIGEEYFGEKILVVPYVVVDGETYLGEVFTYSVNDAGENLKWLGAKGE